MAAQEEPTQAEGPVRIELLAFAEGSDFYFADPTTGERNPDLVVPPGAEVTVVLTSESGFHNIQVEGFDASEYADAGETIEYTFTAPESGSVPYWCVPHKSSGMVGEVIVAAAGEAETPAVDLPTEITLEAVAEGSDFFFRDPETGQRNPRIYVAPSSEITVTLIGVSGLHNIEVEGFGASEYVNADETITYTFTTPESGELPYWCVPHKSSGMAGVFIVGAPPAAGGGGAVEGPEISGPTVDLGTLGFPECAGFEIPRATAEGTVGGPTVADFVELCRRGGETGAQTAVREDHPADYIIPVTWLLIGLGVVATVWVHKRYDP